MRPLFTTTVMLGSILPSRVSTTLTLVKTSVSADGSAFNCAQMHWFKQKKVRKNTRIPRPPNKQKKQLTKIMTEQEPSQLISAARFFSGASVNVTFLQCRRYPHGHTHEKE